MTTLALARGQARLIGRLAMDERRAAHRASILGASWALILPVLDAGVFTLLFGVVLRSGVRPAEYLPFVLVGTLVWRAFARALTASAGALLRAGPLLGQLPVPTATVALGAVCGAGLQALPGLAVLLALVPVLAGFAGIGAGAAWQLPLALVLLGTGAAGLGLLVALANAFYRDVGLALGPVLGALMFATPVVYPAEVVPAAVRGVFLANPVAAAIELLRAAVLGSAPPPDGAVLGAGAVCIVLLGVGSLLHRRLGARAREVV